MGDDGDTFIRGQEQELSYIHDNTSKQMTPKDLVPPPKWAVGYRVLTVQPNSPCTEGKLLAVGNHSLRPWLREHISSEYTLAQKQKLKISETSLPSQQGLDHSTHDSAPKQEFPANHQLVAFLDIVVRINGKDLDHFDELFRTELKNNRGYYPVRLDVYNIKTESMRAIEVVPHEWCGVGTMGMYVRFSEFSDGAENVLHITHVLDGSPADMAGLCPGDDYILGARDAEFSSVEEFSDYIFQKAGEPSTLYIYSRSRDAVREQTLFITTREWMPGQTGLGCQVAQGKLHQLPNRETLAINEWLDRFVTSNNISKLHEGLELELSEDGLTYQVQSQSRECADGGQRDKRSAATAQDQREKLNRDSENVADTESSKTTNHTEQERNNGSPAKPSKTVTFHPSVVGNEEPKGSNEAEPKEEKTANKQNKANWLSSIGEWLLGLEEESVASDEEGEEELLPSPSPEGNENAEKPNTPLSEAHCK